MCDGHTVYQGFMKESPKYFQDLGFKIKTTHNPVDVYMRVLSINYPKGEEEENKIKALCNRYNDE